jgi:uncharacterized protein
MKIRSITFFMHPGWPVRTDTCEIARCFCSAARAAFEASGYEVQTARLATPPFPTWLPEDLASQAVRLEKLSLDLGFEFLSLGPALPQWPDSYGAIPAALAATQNTFFSGMMTDEGKAISLKSLKACAHVIHSAATISADGFANLRFCAMANVPPGTPFFPASYHDGEACAFALAIECADLAVEANRQAKSLAEGRQNLIASIETHAAALEHTAQELSAQFSIPFSGIDFSLAPFPESARSIGTAMEILGLPAVGFHGSLAASAFLTSSLDQARFRRTGFNGLFLPVLEDARLAESAAQSTLSVKDLLMFSAVCGTGLDTVPLPGATTRQQIEAILLDVAALALRLNKPLTARLMPIPGKQAGDPTAFNFSYFANSRVLEVEAEPLTGLLAGDELLQIQARRTN